MRHRHNHRTLDYEPANPGHVGPRAVWNMAGDPASRQPGGQAALDPPCFLLGVMTTCRQRTRGF